MSTLADGAAGEEAAAAAAVEEAGTEVATPMTVADAFGGVRSAGRALSPVTGALGAGLDELPRGDDGERGALEAAGASVGLALNEGSGSVSVTGGAAGEAIVAGDAAGSRELLRTANAMRPITPRPAAKMAHPERVVRTASTVLGATVADRTSETAAPSVTGVAAGRGEGVGVGSARLDDGSSERTAIALWIERRISAAVAYRSSRSKASARSTICATSGFASGIASRRGGAGFVIAARSCSFAVSYTHLDVYKRQG